MREQDSENGKQDSDRKINFAQKVKSGEVRDVIGTPVVYTQDKALALRCRQQEIKYVFIHRNDGKKSVEKSDSKNRGNKVYVQSRRKILEVGKEELARNNLKGYIKKIGSKIGIIFQHQDDLFDVIKSEQEMGKSLSDDKNDKITALTNSSVEELTKKIDDLFGELDYYLLNAPFKTEGLKKLLYSMRTR